MPILEIESAAIAVSGNPKFEFLTPLPVALRRFL
jgi:hypothetical protein